LVDSFEYLSGICTNYFNSSNFQDVLSKPHITWCSQTSHLSGSTKWETQMQWLLYALLFRHHICLVSYTLDKPS